MTLDELIERLTKIRARHGQGTAVVRVMIETGDCQYEYPANDVGYAGRSGYVVIMYERPSPNRDEK